MSPKPRRASADEVRRRWGALSLERRQALMCFDEPTLVERIKTALQVLFERQMLMDTLGIKLNTGAADPFAASSLFTSAFEFTWQIARSASNPHVVLVDPMCMPVMAMKQALLEDEAVFAEMGAVLNDFLSDKSGRMPLAKPRWKDLWATEPTSIVAMEQLLARLVEQALWAMGSDPAYEVPSVASSLEDCLSGDCVQFESWMLSTASKKGKPGDAKKKKKVKKQHRGSTLQVSSFVEPLHDCGAEVAPDTIHEEDNEEEENIGSVMAPSETVQEEEEAAPSSNGADQERSPTQEHREEEVIVFHEPCTPWGGEAATSDDESVGMGSFHTATASASTEVSRDPTAASTPSLAHVKGLKSCFLPSATPPISPLAAHQAMPPNGLVCYIWNQTSQCEHNLLSPRSTAGSLQGQSCTPTPKVAPSAAPSPFARGQWTGSTGTPTLQTTSTISAVVRNTFVDIDDPSECPLETLRKSRSLSPTIRTDTWSFVDHWHI